MPLAHPLRIEEPLAPFRARLVHAPQRLSPEEAEHIALRQYGLHARARPLTGESDENFHLESAQGEFVLKIASPAEEPAVVDLAAAALLHVERADPGFPCPRVRRDRE